MFFKMKNQKMQPSDSSAHQMAHISEYKKLFGIEFSLGLADTLINQFIKDEEMDSCLLHFDDELCVLFRCPGKVYK